MRISDWSSDVCSSDLRYATAAMRHADCAALIIPSLPEYMRASEIVGRLDGVLLTGTPSNVEPARYGGASEGEGPFDPDRDRMMTELEIGSASCRERVCQYV